MKRQPRRPRTTWLGRLIRGRRPDRNPLRRPSDRAETAILVALLATFLAAGPFAARAAAGWTYAHTLGIERVQQATTRQVTATLLQDAPASGWAATGGLTKARWTAPDGRERTGQLPAPAGAAAGSTLLVWTTLDGALADKPLTMGQVSNTATFGGAVAVGGLALALLIAGWVARRALDRRRLAAWEAEWLAGGPRWTSRR